jgi:hypothetical protein
VVAYLLHGPRQPGEADATEGDQGKEKVEYADLARCS